MRVIAPSLIPPITDETSISVRAYAEPIKTENAEQRRAKSKNRRRNPAPASAYTLIFDTETTTSIGQSLRFGTYQWRKAEVLEEAGIFYTPDGMDAAEMEALRSHAATHALMLRTLRDFVDSVFFKMAWQLRATIVGFNLPFDISRLAISHRTARNPSNDESAPMRGGFTFKLSAQKIYPNIRVKHMSRKAALISFAAPMGQRDARGQRKRGIHTGVRRGHFIDVKTLSSALFARSFSLASLSNFLSLPSPKSEFDDFDGPVTAEMIDYAVRDVQATWESYAELIKRYGALKLTQSIPEKIYSEASIGKAYLREMGIQPWRTLQPDMPSDDLAKVVGTYYGGRSEVRIRREIREVMLCDFLSMYPTVCTLMGLWRFVIAKNMTWCDSTEETRAILATTDMETLQEQSVWQNLATIVRVKPDGEIFPVRAPYAGEPQSTIGANHLTADEMWFTLADCIAARLFSGKTPQILEAMTFSPGEMQGGLRPIDVAGNPDYRVDPNTTDFFKRVIELRKSIQREMKGASGEQLEQLDTEQNSLKICANSTSYGIWIEVTVDSRPAKRFVTVSSSTCAAFTFATDKVEMPGRYFHPLLATLITGAARLMLALAERLALDRGLEWVFCDTDSMAFAKPLEMSGEDFARRTYSIVEWFAALNPYDFGGSILKIEDVNGSLEHGLPRPLFCLAISSKRYALFNLDASGRPVMRKVSAHGLGHLLPPYGEQDAPPNFPTPHRSVLKDGTLRWHCDLWFQIVSAVIDGHADIVPLNFHPSLARPAVSRYGASSPDLLAWFKKHNSALGYRDQVKPFGFLLSYSAAWNFEIGVAPSPKKRGRPKKRSALKPVGPYDTDLGKAVLRAFDRETGEAVSLSALKTYAEALAQYHISPESKFLNGDYMDRGTTRRRHVRVTNIVHIGKEAHDWERQAAIGLNLDSQIFYGSNRKSLADALFNFASEFGIVPAAKALSIPRRKLMMLLAAPNLMEKPWALSAMKGLSKAIDICARERAHQRREAVRLRVAIEQDGLRATAMNLGTDPSNLRRKLRRWET